MRQQEGRDRPDSDSEAFSGDLLAALRNVPSPETPLGLTTRILRRARDQLMLRDAVDLMTAGFARVLTGGWLPGRSEHAADSSHDSHRDPRRAPLRDPRCDSDD